MLSDNVCSGTVSSRLPTAHATPVEHTSTKAQWNFLNGGLRKRTSASDNSASSDTGTCTWNDTLHPLRSGAVATGHYVSGITRPHLSRIVEVDSVMDLPRASSDSSLERRKEEKIVLVHHVRSCDSLAGISLKYGINLTDLRRANQMWASDSIHLRTVLYIPVELASRLEKIPLEAEITTVFPRIPVLFNDDTGPQQSTSGTLQWIPASQLSFFPPPSTKASKPTPPSHSHCAQLLKHTHSSTHSPQLFNSFSTSQPIPTSTRETLISSFSLEGSSSSFSDRDSEIFEDLELDNVRSPHSLTDMEDAPFTMKPGHLSSRFMPLPKIFQPSVGINRMSRSHISPKKSFRNVQLEPSPVMVIPSRRLQPDSGGTR